MQVPPSAWLGRVSALLTSGSGILLLGAVGFARIGWGGFIILTALGWTGAMVHFLAWYHLYAARFFDLGGQAMRAAGGTVVGFLAGVFLVGVTLPPGEDWRFAALPYLPFVFAPVVLAHAHLFLSFSENLPQDRDRWLVRAGSHLLVILALAGVFGEAIHALAGFAGVRLSFGDGALFLWTFVPYPAALTSFGYALVWCGWGAVAVREAARAEGPHRDRPQLEPM